MIQEFSVENFYSFGDRQTISFEATSDKKYLDELTVEIRPGVKLLKMAMIYGPNASGKSNLLHAIQAIWEMLFYPQPTKELPTKRYAPFALREGQPSIFTITFYANKVQYDYRLEYDRNRIIFEEMYYYPLGKEALFYRRDTKGIEFGGTLDLKGKAKDQLISNTLDNHTVLSTFGKTNIGEAGEKLASLFNWIKCNIHEIQTHNVLPDIVKEADANEGLKTFMLESLGSSDFNISDFKIVEKEQHYPIEFVERVNQDDSIPDSVKRQLLKPSKKDIEFTHYTAKGDFKLSGHFESKGTLYSLSLIRKFYDLIHGDCVHLIDEIGDGLHLDLVRHNLLRFIRNSRDSQLIFTTHNQLLLMEDFVRRDMVWLTEKSAESAETELIPVASYSLHPNVSLFNSYNIGKLGAKPDLGTTLIQRKKEE